MWPIGAQCLQLKPGIAASRAATTRPGPHPPGKASCTVPCVNDAPDHQPPARRKRDIYGRRPTSTSRGKTQDRIMALQREPGTLPGSEGLFDDAPHGSIAEGILAFTSEWVQHQPVTSSRAYERALVLLAKDLAAHGPHLHEPASALTQTRLAQHLAWRVDNGLRHPGDLVRAGINVAHFADWLDEHRGTTVAASRDELRAVAQQLLANVEGLPPA